MGDSFPSLILSCLAALGLIFLSGLLIRPATCYVQMNAEGFPRQPVHKNYKVFFLVCSSFSLFRELNFAIRSLISGCNLEPLLLCSHNGRLAGLIKLWNDLLCDVSPVCHALSRPPLYFCANAPLLFL